MIERALAASFAAVLVVLAQDHPTVTVPPQRVTLCALRADPAAYDGKLIEVAGDVSHGFEHFQISEGGCDESPAVWLEYGGLKNSNTVYCCGPVANATRPGPLVVQGISIPLVEDQMFKRFDARIAKKEETVFRAMLVGRFFAGELLNLPRGKQWGGYGHIGCCTLLAIQQVMAIDLPPR